MSVSYLYLYAVQYNTHIPPKKHITSQLDGFLVLELSSCPIRRAKTKLVTVQLKLDMWLIQHSSRRLATAIAVATILRS